LHSLHNNGIILSNQTSICTHIFWSIFLTIQKLNQLNNTLFDMAKFWNKYTDSVFSGKSMIILVIGGSIAGIILAILK